MPTEGCIPSRVRPWAFSLGRRDCIGQRMAMAQLRTVLAHIAPRYTLRIASEPVADYFLTLKPANAALHVSLRGK